jgi:hypothetical protein
LFLRHAFLPPPGLSGLVCSAGALVVPPQTLPRRTGEAYNPHASCNEFKATFSIDSLELILGGLPRRELRLVQEWAELHRDELRADWQLAMNGEEPQRIQPLQ